MQSISGTGGYNGMVNSMQKPAQLAGQNVKPASNETQTTEAKKQTEDSKLKLSEKHIKNAINQANEKLKFTRTRCELTYHDEINRVAIKVIDRDTDEVIREIPPEETLELIQSLWEMAGIIIDEKR